MRRFLFLIALLGGLSATVGCDDNKGKTGSSGTPVDPMGKGTATATATAK